jgi:hypothetical protein
MSLLTAGANHLDDRIIRIAFHDTGLQGFGRNRPGRSQRPDRDAFFSGANASGSANPNLIVFYQFHIAGCHFFIPEISYAR